MAIKLTRKGEYKVFSLKTGKVHGYYKEKQAAVNRERQIHYLKIWKQRQKR